MLEIFRAVLEKFESHQIDYMVVGSVASIIYGEPRMTRDMDVVIEVAPEKILQFQILFPIQEFYCPPDEVLSEEVARRGQFNLIHHESGLKIDVVIRKNSHHSRIEFERRQKIPFVGNLEVFVASPEDIIIKKMQFYQEGESEKHIYDIRGILANTQVDYKYLNHWIDQLSLCEVWRKVS